MNPDGSGIKQLTSNSTPDVYPNYSPNGKKITFTRGRYNSIGRYYEIYTMDSDGSDQTPLPTTRWTTVFLIGSRALPGPMLPTSKAECRNDGYKEFGFKDQGRCVAFVNRAARNQ